MARQRGEQISFDLFDLLLEIESATTQLTHPQPTDNSTGEQVSTPVPHPTAAQTNEIVSRAGRQATARKPDEAAQPPESPADDLPGDAMASPRPDSRIENPIATDYIPARDPIVPRAPKDRARANIAAIRTLTDLERQQRPATPAEQDTLARWSGWGAVPHMFDAPHAHVGTWWRQVYDRQIPGALKVAAAALAETGAYLDQVAAGLTDLHNVNAAGVPALADHLRDALRPLRPAADSPAVDAWQILDNAVAAVATAADWQSLREELAGLISPTQWDQARTSTVNAHYTDPAVVRQMWLAITDLGGPGPRVLEPGCGSGTFIGHAPAGTQMIGVELDTITAGVAGALYPSATIHAEGFEVEGWQADSVTSVIGNVPFGAFKVYDAEYNPSGQSIHNHFIIKSLALTAPGGLVAVVTSSYTMDSLSTAARREMHAYGDLLGAVRLPSGAFQAVAGTDVVCDVLLFRRRKPDEAPSPLAQWETAIDVPTRNGPTVINTYFAHHPHRVLGDLQLGSGQHGRTELKVVARVGSSLEHHLAAQLRDIVTDATELNLTFAVDPTVPLPDPKVAAATHQADSISRPGTIRAADNATGFEQLSPHTRTWRPFTIKATKDQAAAARVEARRLLDMRTAAEHLIGLQTVTTDPSTVADARSRLAQQYQQYLAAYGPINRYTPVSTSRWTNIASLDDSEIDPEWDTREQPGRAITSDQPDATPDPVIQVRRVVVDHRRPPAVVALRSDPGFAAVLALELFDDEMMTSKPAPILTEDVLTPKQRPHTAASAAEALAISMAETGTVDLHRVAELLEDGISPAVARQRLGQLVFDDPATDTLVPAGRYLAGDTRSKLDLARHAAAGDDRYTVNVAALRAVVPTDLTPGDIDARPGVTWVPGTDYRTFVSEVLDIDGVAINWEPLLGRWQVHKPKGGIYSIAATRTWGTGDKDGLELLVSLMDNSPITIMRTVYDSNGNERQVPDEVATEAVNDKRDQLANRFNAWLWEDGDRADRLLNIYNRTFNSYVDAAYDGSGLTFPGLGNHFTPRSTQVNAVARILSQRTVLLDHVVGAGKTGTMIMAAMELRRMGKARQPWIVVPNHIVTQVAREAKQWYPAAQIMSGTSSTDAAGRREFAALTATGDYDIVIVPESLFTLLPVSARTQGDYIQSRLDVLEDAIREIKADSGKEATVKELTKATTRLKTRLTAARADGKAGSDRGIKFEQTGCDYLFVDEAHHYKNKMVISGTKDLARTDEPQRATDLDMKLRYLRAAKPDQPFATFATGTPIANSPREMWVMFDYLAPELLQAAGLETFDAWAGNHLRPQTRLEMKPTGSGFAPRTRITSFTNVPDLTRMWRQVADQVTRDDLNIPLPQLKTGTRINQSRPRTPEQADYALHLEARALRAKGRRPEKGADNILRIAGDGRKAALDQRLVALPPPDDGGRPRQIATEILRIHHYTQHRTYVDDNNVPQPRPGALQSVFCDQSTPKPGRWNMYAAIKAELIDAGMPADKIAFIHDARSDTERAELFAKCRDGRVHVIIGSTHKMGTGANIQQRMAGLHHVDPPWRPADLEQREGRELRQGNQNIAYGPVEILTYVTEGTFDAFSWDTVARKARTIAQVKSGGTARHIEADDADTMSYDEIAAVSSGNPLIKERFGVQAHVARLERLERAHLQQQRDNQHAATCAEATLAQLITDLDRLTRARAQVSATSGDQFSMLLGATRHPERVTAGKALTDIIGPLFPRTGILPDLDQQVGTIGGLAVHAVAARGDTKLGFTFPDLHTDSAGSRPAATAALTDLYNAERPGLGVIRQLERQLTTLDSTVQAINDRIAASPEAIRQLTALAAQPFSHADELRTKRDRLRWLNRELKHADQPVVLPEDEQPLDWLTQHPEADQIIWGPTLTRLIPGGATTAAQLRVGDIIAPTTKTSGLSVIARLGRGNPVDIYTHPLGANPDRISSQSRRETTTVGVVGRRTNALTEFEQLVVVAPPTDRLIDPADIDAGHLITVQG